jgi:hypothetical protein
MGYERPASSERSSVENNEVAASHDNNKNVEERSERAKITFIVVVIFI